MVSFILSDRLWYPPRVTSRYSDLSMVVLALVVERIAGQPLEQFAAANIFEPVGGEGCANVFRTKCPCFLILVFENTCV